MQAISQIKNDEQENGQLQKTVGENK